MPTRFQIDVVLAPVALTVLALACQPDPATDDGAADDERALRQAHAAILQAHRDGQVEPWLALEADDYVSANRGTIELPSRAERRAARAPYLEGTRFEYYRDVREPIVAVSDDGSLGWLIAEVEAAGVQSLPDGGEQPVRFTAAWIELYRKEAGSWMMIGNVSNFRPQPAR